MFAPLAHPRVFRQPTKLVHRARHRVECDGDPACKRFFAFSEAKIQLSADLERVELEMPIWHSQEPFRKPRFGEWLVDTPAEMTL